jgi:hypothetical protein
MQTTHRTANPQTLPMPHAWLNASGLRTYGLSALLGLCMLGPSSAWAVLGGAVTPAAASNPTPPAAVQLRSASSAARPASVPIAATTDYTVHSTVLDTGTTVTEYATPAGVVFAVAWQGPVLPRMDALLGNYFAAFTAGAHTTRSQRSVGTPLNVHGTQLVVHSNGRMGHFSGHAYAPSLVPDTVRIGDVLP